MEKIPSITDGLKSSLAALLKVPEKPEDIDVLIREFQSLSRTTTLMRSSNVKLINVDNFERHIANAKFIITEDEIDFI